MKTIQEALAEAFATWDGIRRFMKTPATHTAMGDLDERQAEELEEDFNGKEAIEARRDRDRLGFRG